MLVLGRRPQEEVFIFIPGTDIRIAVTVVEVTGSLVKLGFVAPLTVAIQRREVFERQAAGAKDRP